MTAPRGRSRHLVNAGDAVLELRRTYGVQLSPVTIRQWAARRHIGSYGHGRERYDLREIIEHARVRGLLGDR